MELHQSLNKQVNEEEESRLKTKSETSSVSDFDEITITDTESVDDIAIQYGRYFDPPIQTY